MGQIATVDVFYNPDDDYVTKMRGRHVAGSRWRRRRCFTWRCASARRGNDVRAACILTVSDTLCRGEAVEGDLPVPRGARARPRDRMIEIALEAGTSLSAGSVDQAVRAMAIPVGLNLTSIGVSPAWWLDSARDARGSRLRLGVWSWDHFVSRGRRQTRCSSAGRC